MAFFSIEKHPIGEGSPLFIIAEMSANHGGSFEKAVQILKEAKNAGANALKLQTFKPESLTMDVEKEDFQIPESDPWAGQSLHTLFEKAKTPYSWHKDLFDLAKEIGITLFSSPFDLEGVDLLESLGAPCYKIASPEITHIPLLKKVAKTKKPVIFSTGMATLEDIDLAFSTLKENGCPAIAILKCTSCYPTAPEDVDLNNIPFLKERYRCPVGLSDHTLGDAIPIAATALGAELIEKHIKLDENCPSEDEFFSISTKEFKIMCDKIRQTEKGLGSKTYRLSPKAKEASYEKRSLYLASDVEAGSLITGESIQCVRPSYGLHPKEYESLIGKRFSKNGKKGDRLTRDLIATP